MLIYDGLIFFYGISIKLASVKNKKAKKWIEGRKNWRQKINRNSPNEKIAWFHCASLGEFEQAKPLINKLKEEFPEYKVLVTFFSPSGFENITENQSIDYKYYLPLDTVSNAREFITLINPTVVFFIKYELWYNILDQLFRADIPVYLIAANFQSNHFAFSWYGRFIKNLLPKFEKIFVQYQSSLDVLSKNGINNVVVSGDTRFETVVANCKNANENILISSFKGNNILIVAGSCWEIEEEILNEIAKLHPLVKLVFAPHDISDEKVSNLMRQICNGIKYSEADLKTISSYHTLVIDNIGLLKSLYQYADIALIGGGFDNKLHNILEPAVFGIPILFGNNYSKFPEAEAMMNSNCAFGLPKNELIKKIGDLITDNKARELLGLKSQEFVTNNLGASDLIFNHVKMKKES